MLFQKVGILHPTRAARIDRDGRVLAGKNSRHRVRRGLGDTVCLAFPSVAAFSPVVRRFLVWTLAHSKNTF